MKLEYITPLLKMRKKKNSTRQTGRKSTATIVDQPSAVRRCYDPFGRTADRLQARVEREQRTYRGPVGLGRGKGGLRLLHRHARRLHQRRTDHILGLVRRKANEEKPCIQKAPFMRALKEIMNEIDPERVYRFQGAVCNIIKEAAEVHMVRFFEDVNLAACHANRVTVMVKDIHMVKRMRRSNDVEADSAVLGHALGHYNPPRG